MGQVIWSIGAPTHHDVQSAILPGPTPPSPDKLELHRNLEFHDTLAASGHLQPPLPMHRMDASRPWASFFRRVFGPCPDTHDGTRLAPDPELQDSVEHMAQALALLELAPFRVELDPEHNKPEPVEQNDPNK